MQKTCKRGPQSSEIIEQKFHHLGKFALVKILEGTLLGADTRRCLIAFAMWHAAKKKLDVYT